MASLDTHKTETADEARIRLGREARAALAQGDVERCNYLLRLVDILSRFLLAKEART